MNKTIRLILLVIIVFILSLLVQWIDLHVGEKFHVEHNDMNTSQTEETPLYWTDPMIPGYRSDTPGLSPMGMEMIPVYANDNNDIANSVKISPEITQNMGVRTAPVIREDLSRQVSTVGIVATDEDRIERVNTYAEGWVRQLKVKAAGEIVAKDQVLAEFYSPALINAQREYLLALAHEQSSNIEASYQKLLTLNMTEQQIEQLKQSKQVMELVTIHAPIDGIISDLTVREGMYVTPQDSLMTIADLSQVWVIADVLNSQIPWVQLQQPATAYISDQVTPYVGTVDYIYPQLEPESLTLQVRLRIPNPDLELKLNMYAQVVIDAPAETQVLTIPSESLIRTGDGNHVIVRSADDTFQARSVTIGTEANHKVVVRQGLSEGEQVVTSGQFLIDSETNLYAGFERLSQSTTAEDRSAMNMNSAEDAA